MENAWSTMLNAVRPPTETGRRPIERFPLDTQFLRQSWQAAHFRVFGDEAFFGLAPCTS